MSSQPTSDTHSQSPPSTPRAARPPSHISTSTQHGGPTIRIVEDPGSPVYGKSPFPAEPSQTLSPILSPASARGSRQDGLASPVSESGRSASPGADPTRMSFVQRMAARYETLGVNAPSSQPRQSSASYRASTSTTTSNAETLNTLAAPSSPSYRFSQGTTPPTSPLPMFADRKHDSVGSLGNLLHEDKPTVAPTVRAVQPSGSTTGDAESSSRASQDSSRLSHDYTQDFSHDFSQEYPHDITATSYEDSNESSNSTPTLTYHHKNRGSFSSFASRDAPADRPSTRGRGSERDSVSQQSFWANAEVSTPDERPQTRGSNYIRYGDFDSDEPERPPTRGSNSVRSLSSTHTVNRRPSRANLREASDQSFGSGELSGRPRSSSSPFGTSHENRSIEDNSIIHHPRPSSQGEEWSMPRMIPHPPPRMPEPESPRRYKWSPPLSTIESVSEPRTGSVASTMALSGMGHSKRRQTMGSYGSSDPWTSSEHRSSESRPDIPSTPSEFSVMPRPVFAGTRNGNGQLESRHSEEGDDTVGELHPQPLRLQRSGLFRMGSNGNLSNDGRPDTAASDRSSYSSLFANSIPQWARLYYRRSERVSLAGTDSSSSVSNSPLPSRSATMHSGTSRSPTEANFPIHPIWSPRRRPHDRDHSGSYSGRFSLGSNIMPYVSQDSIQPAPTPKPAQLSESAGPTRTNTAGTMGKPQTAGGRESFTPKLRRNRKSVTLSVWTAPSMDQALGAPANKYILLFTMGFVLPLCWIIAATIPLPKRPNDEFERLENEKNAIMNYHGKGKEPAWQGTELQPTAPGGGATKMGNESNIEGGLGLDLRNKTQEHQRDWAQEERLWQKAKWWRRVNRIMSVVGLCVIAAVVAIAVVETRKRQQQ